MGIEQIEAFFGAASGYVWGWPLIILLGGTGFWLTILLRGVQFSKLGYALNLALIKRSEKDAEHGDISNFQALMTALSATVGTGNIAGVATAMFLGGPGALFWMWIMGLVGMATKYGEAILAVRYRVVNENGEMSGGPMYYISRGMNNRWLAATFAFLAAVAAFGLGCMVQSNAVSQVLEASFGIEGIYTGIALAIGTAAVVIGGVKSIGRVTSVLVPIMIVVYFVGAFVILLLHASEIPGALSLIIHSAFHPTAATGGFAGSAVMMTIRMGVARGIFSNESGLGSGPIAAAAAKTNHPVSQALVSMTQTFIDTIIVCSMTGLVILVTGSWTSGITGAALTSHAFSLGLPGTWGHLIITVSLLLFSYSTILGWCYYGEKSCSYLLGEKSVTPYRLAFVICCGMGAVMKLSLVWTIADVFNGLMAFPNLIALLALSPVIAQETKDYFGRFIYTLSDHPDTSSHKA